ncbi:hypothetical protein C0Q70_10414 [Pomacea canaliculata]|uniref:AD domain-containing protein n=2 Tax=Pomacea canaliculata TaxID=400727 RepID=A0A2T7PCJ5_POMCA|nr:hypothetical protein C0Q70_10414 [Pomacea canaliculata]
MAENSEYFSIGSTVRIVTCHNVEMRGEVVAFDVGTKFLILKSPTAGKHGAFDMKVVNLNLVSDLCVVSEGPSSPPPLGSVNIAKVQSRVKQSLDEKMRQLNLVGIDVTPEGQQLMNSISKTIVDVRWENQNIVVMNTVVIKPPYRVDDCKVFKECPGNAQVLAHISKIVEKHHSDEMNRQAQLQNDSQKSTSPSPAPSSPASSAS